MSKLLCIYHGNCADGFGAAWAVRHRCQRDGIPVEFHAGIYQDPPPDVTGRDVILVDFSYKRDVIAAMAETARRVLVLDHHKSAKEDLGEAFLNAEGAGFTFDRWRRFHGGGVMVFFDMERSGAGIVWDFFNPGTARPRLIDHVEDRDLWRFALPGTREIQAALVSYPYDFKLWDMLMGGPIDELHREGVALLRQHDLYVAELAKVCKRRLTIAGFDVPAASMTYMFISDVGHLMAQGEPFAACYFDVPEGRVFSLRSTDAGEDVSAIAKLFGGGGHRNASGFRVPFDRLGTDGSPPEVTHG